MNSKHQEKKKSHQWFLKRTIATLHKQKDSTAWLPTTVLEKDWIKVKKSATSMKQLLSTCPEVELIVRRSQLMVRKRQVSPPSKSNDATPIVVNSSRECAYVANLLDNALLKDPIIAVDLEGQLNKGGKVWLVQAATANQVYIFYLLTTVEDRERMVALLTELFESNKITKIMHDCRRDNEALRFLLNIELKNVIDTQVFHAYIQKHKLAAPRSKRNARIGLNELLETYGCPINNLKDQMHQMFNEKSEADIVQMWTTRPLSHQILAYAADDVRQLCACYQAMKRAIIGEAETSVLSLSDAHARTYLQLRVLGEPEKISFAADGTAIYCPITLMMSQEPKTTTIVDNNGREFIELLVTLPKHLRLAIEAKLEKINKPLVEIVVDYGRCPSLLFADGTTKVLKEKTLNASAIVSDCLKSIAKKTSYHQSSWRGMFTDDNRMGLPGTLHRISGLLNRRDEYVGLTFRIGRHISGASELISDLIARAAKEGKGILLVGCPGSGKTTLLRDIIGSLGFLQKRVIIVDTSNDICGDGDVPHECIGRARRVQVKHRTAQHEVMIEAVQNHNPELIVIDEIGTVKEVVTAKTIAQRGVTLIGTAHGFSLGSILKNPDLTGLIGGLQTTTLGDIEMQKRGKGKKTILERVGTPIFSVAVEVLDKQRFRIISNVAKTIDAMLADQPFLVEERWREGGEMFSRRFYENSPAHGSRDDWFHALVEQAIAAERFNDHFSPGCR